MARYTINPEAFFASIDLVVWPLDKTLLFMYLQMSEGLGYYGIGQMHVRQISSQTGLALDRVVEMLKQLSQEGFIYWDRGILYCPVTADMRAPSRMRYWRRTLRGVDEKFRDAPAEYGPVNVAYKAWRDDNAELFAQLDAEQQMDAEQRPSTGTDSDFWGPPDPKVVEILAHQEKDALTVNHGELGAECPIEDTIHSESHVHDIDKDVNHRDRDPLNTPLTANHAFPSSSSSSSSASSSEDVKVPISRKGGAGGKQAHHSAHDDIPSHDAHRRGVEDKTPRPSVVIGMDHIGVDRRKPDALGNGTEDVADRRGRPG